MFPAQPDPHASTFLLSLVLDTVKIYLNAQYKVVAQTDRNTCSQREKIIQHPGGRTLISDWFPTSFINAVHQNFLKSSVSILCPKHN